MASKEDLVKYWKRSGIIRDERLFRAFRKISREGFITKELLNDAYGDYPLPIGAGQTISQPTTVMIMTDALELKEGDKVLEVGAGSGYHAAIIAEIVGKKGKVITTEIIPELAEFAKRNIEKNKIKNVEIIEWDGSQGYDKEAPYDRIIVTAACPSVPEPLVGQLKENGILLAPVGPYFGQQMIRLRKKKGDISEESLGGFMFVPLKGKHGYS